MPNKTCPKCAASIHVRTATCKCGHGFYTSVKKVEEAKKLPAAESPETEVTIDLKKKLSDYTEKEWIEAHKGMGYTLKLVNPDAVSFNKKYVVTTAPSKKVS